MLGQGTLLFPTSVGLQLWKLIFISIRAAELSEEQFVYFIILYNCGRNVGDILFLFFVFCAQPIFNRTTNVRCEWRLETNERIATLLTQNQQGEKQIRYGNVFGLTITTRHFFLLVLTRSL